jgi:sortase B
MTCLYGLWHEIQPQMKSRIFYQSMIINKNQLYINEESKSQKDNYTSSDETSSHNNQWLIEMMKTYQNMVGWIRCEAIHIDYPIMQTDDNSFYLSHLPDGSNNRLGSIFLDKSANRDFSSPVSIIYGHMMQDGEMFGELKKYRKQDFYDKHSKLQLYTTAGEKDVILLAAYLVDGSSNPFPNEFDTSEDLYSYIKEIKSRSFFVSKETAVLGDKLIILSTCAYDFNNARLAIVGYIKP